MKNKILLTISFLIILGIDTYPQIGSPRLNILAGLTRNFHMSTLVDNTYAFNPEIQLEGELIKSKLNWMVYLSYWDDNVSGKSYRVVDVDFLYSYNDLNIGTRLYVLLTDLSQPYSYFELSFFGGVSHSFIRGTEILRMSNEFPKDINFEVNVGDLGARILFPLYKRTGISAEYALKADLGKKDFSKETIRNSFKLGVSYFF